MHSFHSVRSAPLPSTADADSSVSSSASSVLSAAVPLLAHLLDGNTNMRATAPVTPRDYSYLVAQKRRPVEETPEHQDFASSLL
jgi:hypothetical protein